MVQKPTHGRTILLHADIISRFRDERLPPSPKNPGDTEKPSVCAFPLRRLKKRTSQDRPFKGRFDLTL